MFPFGARQVQTSSANRHRGEVQGSQVAGRSRGSPWLEVLLFVSILVVQAQPRQPQCPSWTCATEWTCSAKACRTSAGVTLSDSDHWRAEVARRNVQLGDVSRAWPAVPHRNICCPLEMKQHSGQCHARCRGPQYVVEKFQECATWCVSRACGSFGKRCLFFFEKKKNFFSETRLPGDRVNRLVKHLVIRGVRCASNCPVGLYMTLHALT